MIKNKIQKIYRWTYLLFALVACNATAQVCSAPGFDGPNGALSGVINTYHAGSGSAAAGSSQVTVASIAGQRTSNRSLIAGDLVLIMQMQDSATPANAGLYEYALVQSITGSVLTLNRALTNSYVQGITVAAGVTTAWRTFQVVRVPQYSSATVTAGITADRWTVSSVNGQGTGGVVAMDVAGSLAINSSISADGAGFRGGAAVLGAGSRVGGTHTDANYSFVPANANGAVKGEGIVGTPFRIFDGTATVLAYATGTFGQGFAAGAGGQGAQGNSGGGGNDGNPAAGNGLNSGGGGGGNGGAGGQGGFSWTNQNDAGGRGGVAVTNVISRVVLGGGGGAGGNNNGTNPSTVTTWPPTVNATTRPSPPTTGTANGANGFITSSGASGGGVVLIRAGALSATAGSISAQGYTAYNTSSGSDAAGGGGAGGSIIVLAASGTGTGLSLNVTGGGGGYSNYFDHGPGGGGAGGFIMTSTNLTGVSTALAGGGPGNDGCCGGVQGNSSPKVDGATTGTGIAVTTSGASAPGTEAGAACMPVLTVSKVALTPQVIVPAGTTAQYAINVTNASTAGAAYGVAISDVLPIPFGLATVVTAATTTYSGTNTTGPVTTTPNRSGVTPTAVFGVAGTGNNPTTPSFTIYPGGSVTVTFRVSLNTTTFATYQNSATVAFTDPTRTTGAAATGSAVVSPNVGPGGTYASGAAVGGSNYSSSSSTADDVKLVAGTTSLTISKTNGVNSLIAGQTTSYTITVANLGPTAAPGTVLTDPAVTGLSCTSVTCTSTAANMCPASPSISALQQSTGLQISPTFAANTTATFVVRCGVTATGQ